MPFLYLQGFALSLLCRQIFLNILRMIFIVQQYVQCLLLTIDIREIVTAENKRLHCLLELTADFGIAKLTPFSLLAIKYSYSD